MQAARIYEAMCQACHQADGRGQPGRAASLVGSPLALASPDVPVRILLNGKEGSTGLMPSLGAAMTDAQVANVLTYVRREWGHGASPIDAATVARAARRHEEPHPPLDRRGIAVTAIIGNLKALSLSLI